MSASQDARQVLLELSMLAGGSVANLNSETKGGGDQAGPSGDGRIGREPEEGNLFLYWSQAFASASWDALPDLVATARESLEGFKRGNRTDVELKPETDKQRFDRIVKEGRGWSVDLVSVSLRVTAGEVRAARLGAGLDPSTGEAWSTGDELARARAMKASGLRTREIAEKLQVSVGKAHKLANG